MVAPHVFNAVVRGQTLIDEGIIGAEKIHHAAVFVEDAVDEHLHLGAERRSERGVEGRINVGVGLERVHVANFQPLEREVGGQCLRARVGQHAADLMLQRFGIVQFALLGRGEQFLVGNAAPQEERQARRQFDAVQPVNAAGLGVGGRRLRRDTKTWRLPASRPWRSQCRFQMCRTFGPSV